MGGGEGGREGKWGRVVGREGKWGRVIGRVSWGGWEGKWGGREGKWGEGGREGR